MNKKTINKLLTRKHNDFLKSINDEAIKKLINENSIITGGSIVSMLLNEKVNDYDYYFADKDTCLKVANYYVGQFLKSHPDCKIKPYVEEDGDRIKIIVKSAGLAGEKGDDGYKYFESRPAEEGEEYVEGVTASMPSAQEVIADADEIDSKETEKLEKEPYRPIFMTSNAITLSNHVQLILRFYGGPEDIHKNYDFIHCTNYWISKNKEVVLNQAALESILAKQLYYVGSLYPLCSVIRTRKFIKKGWHINAGQYLKMCFQVSELNLKDIAVLEEQLVGVDNAYFVQIVDYFKKRMEEDPAFKIEMPYLISIIDKIF